MKKSPMRDWLDQMKGKVSFEVDKGDGTAETCDVLVCRKFDLVEGLIFQDNRIGKCEGCGCPVQFRPHAPTKPKRVCFECAPALGTGDKMMVTEKTAAELLTYYANKGSKH